MSDLRPVLEDELHALVDGRLDPERREELEAWLAAHPEARARVEGWTAGREALRAALDPVAQEPVPPALNLRRMAAERRRTPRAFRLREAASVALTLAIGAAGGWGVRGMDAPAPRGVAALGREAVMGFRTFASDPVRPVELDAGARPELVSWISTRLHRRVTPPDLRSAGYRLLGGRIVATAHGPGGLFLYQGEGDARLAVYMRPMAQAHEHAPMRDRQDGDLGDIAWADDGLGFSVVGAAAPEALRPLAEVVRRQTPGSGPA